MVTTTIFIDSVRPKIRITILTVLLILAEVLLASSELCGSPYIRQSTKHWIITKDSYSGYFRSNNLKSNPL